MSTLFLAPTDTNPLHSNPPPPPNSPLFSGEDTDGAELIFFVLKQQRQFRNTQTKVGSATSQTFPSHPPTAQPDPVTLLLALESVARLSSSEAYSRVVVAFLRRPSPLKTRRLTLPSCLARRACCRIAPPSRLGLPVAGGATAADSKSGLSRSERRPGWGFCTSPGRPLPPGSQAPPSPRGSAASR